MKEPTCEECRGACCEFVPIMTDGLRLPGNQKWWRLHGLCPRPKENRVILFRKCVELSSNGWCMEYDKRPKACRVYLRGGPDCLAAIELVRPRYAARLRRG